MKKKKESTKNFREIVCNRCGTCCTEPIVPVTDSDVYRLCQFKDVSADKIVTFYGKDEIDFDSSSGFWINFKDGRKVMGLRKPKDRCTFLTKDELCSVYEERPMTCRTFPYMIDFDDDCNPKSVKQNKIVNCKSCRKGLSTLEDKGKEVLIELAEDEAYFEKVDEWNAHKTFGSMKDFLKYLCLP
jgi:Fe-S-cluster containining protein